MAGTVEASKEVLISEVFFPDVLYGKKMMLISDVRMSQISSQKK
jgi:hypothetical protein